MSETFELADENQEPKSTASRRLSRCHASGKRNPMPRRRRVAARQESRQGRRGRAAQEIEPSKAVRPKENEISQGQGIKGHG